MIAQRIPGCYDHAGYAIRYGDAPMLRPKDSIACSSSRRLEREFVFSKRCTRNYTDGGGELRGSNLSASEPSTQWDGRKEAPCWKGHGKAQGVQKPYLRRCCIFMHILHLKQLIYYLTRKRIEVLKSGATGSSPYLGDDRSIEVP